MVTQQQAMQMANAFKEDACLFMDMNPSSIHLELTPLSNIPKGISPFTTVDCDAIITRNKKDFTLSETPVYTPEEFLHIPYYWSEDSGTMMLNEPMEEYRKRDSNMSI